MPSRLLPLTAVAALTAFCVVQDRVTAAGAERYVAMHRPAASADRVTLDGVMAPAIRRSVQLGLASGGGVLAAGWAVAAWTGRGRGQTRGRRRE